MPPSSSDHPEDLAYRVRLADIDGTSRVIYGPPDDDDDPTASETEEYTEQDPVLAEFARHPYDPLVSARATGRLLGLAATQAQGGHWLRIVAGILGLGLLVIGLLGAARWTPFMLALSLVGALMLWHTLPLSRS